MDRQQLSTYVKQFMATVKEYPEAIHFSRRHRLWNGLLNYGWVSKLLLVIAFILGLKFLMEGLQWIRHFNSEAPLQTMGMMGGMLQDFAFDIYRFLFVGSMKYIVMILMEVVIFHFSRMALEKLTGSKGDRTFDTFVEAQIRMIKVSVRSWIAESIISAIIAAAFIVIPDTFNFIKTTLIFGVHCYYLGFVILDNYHEQFNLSIKQSAEFARNFMGVALAAGLSVQILLMVPFIGAILAPLIASVAVTLAMYKLSDLHIRNLQSTVEPDEIV